MLLGLLLVGVGILVLFAPAGLGVRGWLMRLWPLLMICAGVIRVMGFAVERKPRSPIDGMLLIVIGALFFAGRFHSDLNALALYGRYWILLLGIFAGVELVRFYSHRNAYGPQPRLFSAGRSVIVLLIIGSGVLANRVANNPAVLSALHLPRFLDTLRESVAGQSFAFTDAPVESREFAPGMTITITNSYGGVKVIGGNSTVKATLAKAVRGWNEEDARAIADKVSLLITRTPQGLNVTTTRDEINRDFTTDIQVEIPESAGLVVNNSYGNVSAIKLLNGALIRTSHGQTEINQISGNVRLDLSYSDVSAANIHGDLAVNGAKSARLSNISGAVDLTATSNGGVVDLRQISGPTRINAPFCNISAVGLSAESTLRTEHARVDVTSAVGIAIEAPYSNVRAQTVNGNVTVSSSDSSVQLASISGTVDVNAERCAVTVEDARGDINIDTSHREVSIKDFYEGAHVKTSYSAVTLIAAQPPAGDIAVENSHGEIKLMLPQSSQFVLDAATDKGEIRPVGFNDIAQRTRGVLSFANGSGPKITLRTSYRNITIQASAPRQTQASVGVSN